MVNQDFKLELIGILKEDPMCNINLRETQYTIRCPYCDDMYSTDHGHFSLHIDIESDDPILYRCLKCPASGLLSSDTLLDLDVQLSIESLGQLKNFNRKIIKKNRYIDNGSAAYIVPLFSDIPFNHSQLKYVNDRLGTSFGLEDASRLKIVLNLYEFLKSNDLGGIPDVSPNYLEILSKYYVGFLSSNNNVMTLRCTSPHGKMKRYVKLIIDPRNVNANSFYNIPNAIDMLYIDDINIHITEGVFDILSVYANLRREEKKNNFYYAACGFGTSTILKYLVYNGINTGLNVHIYADKDKSDKLHIALLRKSGILPWIKSVRIHRNTFPGEKDYGVPAEKMIDTYRKAKIQ